MLRVWHLVLETEGKGGKKKEGNYNQQCTYIVQKATCCPLCFFLPYEMASFSCSRSLRTLQQRPRNQWHLEHCGDHREDNVHFKHSCYSKRQLFSFPAQTLNLIGNGVQIWFTNYFDMV